MNAIVQPPPVPRAYYLRFMNANLDDAAASRLLGTVEGARERGAIEIHIAVNILGGTTQTAVAVYNSLLHSATPISVYNIGTIASAGTTAFLGGRHRYCSATATFMIHPQAIFYNGNLTMPYATDLVANNTATEAQIEAILRLRTQLPDQMLQDRRIKDVHINAQSAVDLGLVSEIREFVVPAGIPIVQVL